MSYTPNVPTIGQSLGASRPLINSNFQYLNTWAAVNHYFNVANGGKHKFVQMPITTIPTTAANEGALYTKVANGQSNLFYTCDNGTREYQITRCNDSATPFSRFGTNTAYGSPPAGFTQEGGWTFLPGGLLFQYGFYGKSGDTGSSGTVQYPTSFTTATFSVQLVGYRTSGRPFSVDSNNPPTTSNFKFVADSSGADGLYWVAIGK